MPITRTSAKKHAPVDVFAMKVVQAMSYAGIARDRAIAEVESQEPYVRKAFAARVDPAFVAQNIARQLKGRRPARGTAYVGLTKSPKPTGRIEGGERVLPPVRGGGIAFDAFDGGGRRPGHDSGSTEAETLPASNIVCTSTGWQPALFIPRDQLGPQFGRNDNELLKEVAGTVLEPKLRRLFVAGRGAVLINPDEIQEAREKAERIVNRDPDEVRAEMEHVRRAVTDKDERAAILRRLGQKIDQRAKAMKNVELQVKRPAIWMQLAEILKQYTTVSSNADNTSWISGAALMAEQSGNEKIGSRNDREARFVATTYTSIEASCPSSCVLKYGQDGKVGSCYAQNSNNIRPIVLMLDAIAEALGHDGDMVARDEARAIDASFQGANGQRGVIRPTDLRIHTSGDAQTPTAARMLAAAFSRLQARQVWRHLTSANRESFTDPSGRTSRSAILSKVTQPMQAWSYTHAWRATTPRDWGNVSVLASVQKVQESIEAIHKGWAPTIVVPAGTFAALARRNDSGHFRSFELSGDVPIFQPIHTIRDKSGGGVTKVPGKLRRIKYIPCPAQHPDKTKKVGCVNCRMCFDAEGLRASGHGIAFEAHGSGAVAAEKFDAAEEMVADINRRRLPLL